MIVVDNIIIFPFQFVLKQERLKIHDFIWKILLILLTRSSRNLFIRSFSCSLSRYLNCHIYSQGLRSLFGLPCLGVSQVSLRCLLGVSQVSLRYLLGISQVSLRSLLGVSQVFLRYLLCLSQSQGGQRRFDICFLRHPLTCFILTIIAKLETITQHSALVIITVKLVLDKTFLGTLSSISLVHILNLTKFLK